ncbi:sigma-54 interaction domain-containing protein [Neobacillus drentensis]|uniref:sigma-54 interaction domain-containing protein n=1 Tax=Neobacillus drentensis TaxID=220684 RepID=UPI002FFD6A9C
MKVEDYFIKEALSVPWPASMDEILFNALESTYSFFLLIDGEKIVGCIKRETLSTKIKEVGLNKIRYIPIESITTNVSIVIKEQVTEKLDDPNKIIVVKEESGKIKGVFDLEIHTNLQEKVGEDKWLFKEMQAFLDEFFLSVFVTDEKGKVLRVTSQDDQQHLGKNVFDLEQERVFYPSITAKVLKSGKRETGIQYTKKGEIFQIESIPVKNEVGEVVRVLSITKDTPELTQLKRNLEDTKALLDSYQREIVSFRQDKYEDKALIFKDKKMEEVFELIRSVASVDTTVLILGETGVGKQMVANQIHSMSHRRDKPFITINCGAIPENLLETELFGYEEGAFSGTRKGGKLGLLQIADKGTIFLDEIGELTPTLQVKLLRVLQEKVIMKVGGTKEQKIDVRIITATNKDLKKMILTGTFREDLYYRIHVVPIQIPPLRERREDIHALSYYFLKRFNKNYQKYIQLLPNQLEQLLGYSWPGNVRELENVIERIVVLEKPIFFEKKLPVESYFHEQSIFKDQITNLTETMEKIEKEILLKTIEHCSTTREMAKRLGVNQSTIVRKLQKFGIR